MVDRATFSAGLRKIADLIDDNPDLELPYHGGNVPLFWVVRNAGRFDHVVDAFTRVESSADAKYHHIIDGQIDGVKVSLGINHKDRVSTQEPELGVVA